MKFVLFALTLLSHTVGSNGKKPFTELPDLADYKGEELCPPLEVVNGRKIKVVQSADLARCRSMQYIYTTVMFEMDCGPYDDASKSTLCNEDVAKKLCRLTGTESGKCDFAVQTMPYGNLRQVKRADGEFKYNWDTHAHTWTFGTWIGGTYRKQMILDSMTRNLDAPGLEVEDTPNSYVNCGAIAFRVINNQTGNPVAPPWHSFLPVPCQDHTGKFQTVLPFRSRGPTEGYDLYTTFGQPVQLIVSYVLGFKAVTYVNGTQMCFDGTTMTPDNCRKSPRIKLQDEPWWDQTYFSMVKSMPGSSDAFGEDGNPRTPFHIQLNYALQDSSVEPNARCQASMYLYGVLGSQIVCNGSCYDESQHKCKPEAVNTFCDEGTDPAYMYCDLKIFVETVGLRARNIKRVAKWKLPYNVNPANYMDEHNDKQNIYFVNESKLQAHGIPDKECYGFHVQIWDSDQDSAKEWDLLDEGTFYPPIPNTTPDSTIMMPVASHASVFKSRAKTCTGAGKSSPDGWVWLDVHFFIWPLYVKTQQGENLCKPVPGTPEDTCVLCPGYRRPLFTSDCPWEELIKSHMKKHYPGKEPAGIGFGTQKDGMPKN